MSEDLKVIRHTKPTGAQPEKVSEPEIGQENFSDIDEKNIDGNELSSKKTSSPKSDLEGSTDKALERVEFGKYVFILGEDSETDKDLRNLIWYLKNEGTHF